MTRLIDEAIPRWDVNEVHEAFVPVPPERAYDAVRSVTVGEVRLLVPFMALRLLPAILQRKAPELRLDAPVHEAMAANGFSALGERPPEELAFGVVGRFWQLSAASSLRPVGSAAELAAFAEPGYARAATDFRVLAAPGGSRVITETRIASTDEAARRSFARYWRLIGAGSGLIRVSWLNAIRRRAGGG